MNELLVEKGKLALSELPSPVAGDDEVLVRVEYSLVSTGTELSSVKKRENILLEAIRDPKLVEKFKKLVSQRGILNAVEIARTKIGEPSPLGYSNAGIAVQVGRNVTHVKAGDKIACAGAGHAVHANYVVVPKNLVVKVPHDVKTIDACFAGVGAIALQGVRRADPKIGETIVVYGLGLVGMLTGQILLLNGVNVIGVDISKARLNKAKSLGINAVEPHVLSAKVAALTATNGADAVIVTAATPSSELVNKAAVLCRRKGKLVIVGDVGLNLDREELYKRELDVLISTSYGPGRYDSSYEEKGADYPFAYVRWTEQRNLQSFVHLLTSGLKVEKLIDVVKPIHSAVQVFNELKKGRLGVVVLQYGKEAKSEPVLQLKPVSAHSEIRACLIGPGNFAKSTVIPAINHNRHSIQINSVASTHPANAKYVAELCKASKCFTDYNIALEDKSTNAAIITTRHDSHAQLVIRALENNKHVFVEKPLALNEVELRKIERVVSKQNCALVVGHNRRYSPVLEPVKKFLESIDAPRIVSYRVAADALPLDHFLNDSKQGGRIIGEMVHFFDVFTYLCRGQVTKVTAASNGYDNLIVTVEFSDSSLCNLIYTTLASPKMQKERIEVFAGGNTVVIEDFSNAFALTSTGQHQSLYKGKQNKGHSGEIAFFADAVKGKIDYRENLSDAITATRIAFKVLEQLQTR